MDASRLPRMPRTPLVGMLSPHITFDRDKVKEAAVHLHDWLAYYEGATGPGKRVTFEQGSAVYEYMVTLILAAYAWVPGPRMLEYAQPDETATPEVTP